MDSPDVLLFSTPWVSPSHAPLGLGIVAAQLRAADIVVETHHPNVGFYRVLHDGLGGDSAKAIYRSGEAGEVAAGLLYRQRHHPFDPQTDDLTDLLAQQGIDEQTFWKVVRSFKLYTARSLAAIDFEPVRAVGFTLCIHQTMSSLYWAQQISEVAPHVSVVFGGSTCEDPMGLALMAAHPVIDVMTRGEADTSIVPLFEHLLGRSDRPIDSVPNIAVRQEKRIVATDRELIGLSSAVAPDHSDFMNEYRHVEDQTGEAPNLYLEASRGCWWGERRQCTFCGIHTTAIEFRAKQADRVVDEVRELLGRHQVFRFVLADTILSKQHFECLLPELEKLRVEHDFEYFLDVKSPLSREDVGLLARSGCQALQVGIEALSDRLLRLVKKGNTALQQIQAIRLCTEIGISPFYAILTHVIDEKPEDYEETLAYMRIMRHLVPPAGVFPIELNRYAPYYEEWKELGFREPQPAAYYRLMFGPDGTDLDAFAYHFSGTHPSTQSPQLEEARARVRRFVDREWRPAVGQVRLSFRVGRGFVQITEADSRSGERRVERLSGLEAEVFLACDEISTKRELVDRFAGVFEPDMISRALVGLGERGWMARSTRGEVYLSMPTCEHPSRPASPESSVAGRSQPGRSIPVIAR